MTGRRKWRRLTPGEATGGAALAAAALLATVDGRLAAVPLTLFVMASMLAPFMPVLGFFMPVATRGRSTARGVALTFDDGPDPQTTPRLLALLRRYRVPATFFVTGQRAAVHPELMDAICRDGHDVGNHSHRHDMLLMLRGPRRIAREIDDARAVLSGYPCTGPAFRPPVGVVGPDLGPVLAARGMRAVTYSCRAMDGGNRWIRGMARRVLIRVAPGDIIMLHDVAPKGNGRISDWEREITAILDGLARRRLPVRRLDEMVEGLADIPGGADHF